MSLGAALGLMLQVAGATPAIVERAHVDPRADVSFHAIAVPETVFVGAAVRYELGVFIADEVRQRLRRNPEFVPPELRSVLAYDLRDSRQVYSVVREGRAYGVHVFLRALFPVAPGTIVVPPASLSYSLPAGASFFSREETKVLKSESLNIVAIPPPTAGRPAAWNGAVGDLRISVAANAGKTRVGDPFVVTARVSGEANVHLLPRPVLALSWASVVPSAERVSIDTMASVVRGTKEFDWLVTPSVEGREELPPVEYPYFDPAARDYRTARSAPSTVMVGEGTLAAVDTSAAATALPPIPLRVTWSRPLPDAPDRSLWFWILVVLVPVPAVAKRVRERPRRRARSAPEAALEDLAETHADDGAQVRRALHAALHARLGASPIPWADPVLMRRALRRHGVTDATIDEAIRLFAQIDGAAYGGAAAIVPSGARSALALYHRIDDEARGAQTSARNARRGARGRRTAAVVLIAGSAGALYSQGALSARTLFQRGVDSYARNNVAAAASDFLAAGQAEPAAAAAWADAGTASWMANDTARAVVGWQRALRLDPLDDYPRELLARVGADAGSASNVVWPVPRRVPAWMALFLWIGGWIALWRGRRKHLAEGAVAAAVVLGTLSAVHHARLVDSRVVVMARPAPLRSLPALGAEAGAVPLTGELLTVVDRSGLWVRVRAADDRDGWIDAARVIDLNAHPLRD